MTTIRKNEVVYKYELPVEDGPTEMLLPCLARIIHWDSQFGERDTIQFWAIVDPKEQKQVRVFFVRGTGHAMGAAAGCTHCATVVTAKGALVWHVFERMN